MTVQPYLFFEGCCEEAIAFYAKAIDAKLEVKMLYKDSPEPMPEGTMPPGSENKVMHAAIKIGEARVLVSDGHCSGKTSFQGFSLTLDVADAAEAKRRFDALSEGGTVIMPLAPTFFSPCFGTLTDRFGLGWLIIVPQPM